MVDYKYFYKFLVRNILLHNLFYRKGIANIAKLVLFFNVSKYSDLNVSEVYNYIYLFKYFFGRKAFITKIKSHFSLGKWAYSLKIMIVVSKRDLFSV